MSLTVQALELGRAITDGSFFVRGRTLGTLLSAPVHGYRGCLPGAGDGTVGRPACGP
jgi:hypothetical protein